MKLFTPRSDKKRSGFTLIELIIVIVIIAILAAIAIPAMNGYINDAKQGTANANARQVLDVSNAALASMGGTNFIPSKANIMKYASWKLNNYSVPPEWWANATDIRLQPSITQSTFIFADNNVQKGDMLQPGTVSTGSSKFLQNRNYALAYGFQAGSFGNLVGTNSYPESYTPDANYSTFIDNLYKTPSNNPLMTTSGSAAYMNFDIDCYYDHQAPEIASNENEVTCPAAVKARITSFSDADFPTYASKAAAAHLSYCAATGIKSARWFNINPKNISSLTTGYLYTYGKNASEQYKAAFAATYPNVGECPVPTSQTIGLKPLYLTGTDSNYHGYETGYKK